MTFIDDTGGRHFVGECERGYCVREVLEGGYECEVLPYQLCFDRKSRAEEYLASLARTFGWKEDHLAAPETESRHHRGGRKHGNHKEAEEMESEQSLFGDR